MRLLIRETARAGAATASHERAVEVAELSFGCAPDSAVQIIGRGVARRHGRLRPDGDGLAVECAPGCTVRVAGGDVRRAHLAVGESLELAGATLEVRRPPPGFDAALGITPARQVDAADFEAAYLTRLEQTWLSRRRMAWGLGLVVLLLGLLLPWLVPRELLPWWSSDQVWSSGPLHPAHAVAIGDDCSACHVTPFQRVADTQCVACHAGVTDHTSVELARHVGLDGTRCAACHQEHNEPVHLTVSADALCTDCHAAPAWPDHRLVAVQGFTLDDHPPFRADLLISAAEPSGTGFGYHWETLSATLADAVDHSNLKFPHDVHLNAAQVQDLATGAALACGACHRLQADDEHFAPIRMERHCRACHDLKFDRRAPERELPHGDPAEVLLTMEGHFMREYADPDLRAPERARRRLPDRASDTERCDGPAYVCARQRTAREAETQFTRRGCVTCHEVAVHDSNDLLGRYQVVPVRLTADFFPIARFDHRAHLTQRDASGDSACLDCHPAVLSGQSRDVLIPDIEQCLACHSDHRHAGRVSLHCIDCHAFHPRGMGEAPE
jgi:hypothetical protein